MYDVTLRIQAGMMVWPGDPAVDLEPSKRMARGDSSNVSTLHFGSHTGTHVDPPFHFIDGAPGVDALDLDALIGPAHVLDLRSVSGQIQPKDLHDVFPSESATRVLFRTSNSDFWAREQTEFPEEYVSLSLDGARWLVERGVRLVGTDFLSIEQRGAPGHPTHVALLEAGVVIVEGLDLHDVEPGRYDLICAPLRITGGDGAPARAVLLA